MPSCVLRDDGISEVIKHLHSHLSPFKLPSIKLNMSTIAKRCKSLSEMAGFFLLKEFLMLDFIKKLVFSSAPSLTWNRGDSTDSKAMAKSKQGSAVATTGPQSPACVAGGNITVAYDSVGRTAIEDEDACRKLLEPRKRS